MKRGLLSGGKDMKNLESILKSRHHLADKGPSSQSYGFSSSHVWMWELDQKEGWELKHQCFQTVVLEKTLESPLDIKEIKPVNPKGNQSWIFIGRTDAEARTRWPPDVKSQLIRKDSDTGKDWRQEDKRTTENEMAGWHHWLNAHELEQTLGDNEGQGGVACYSPRSHKKLDTTWWLNNKRNNKSTILNVNDSKDMSILIKPTTYFHSVIINLRSHNPEVHLG